MWQGSISSRIWSGVWRNKPVHMSNFLVTERTKSGLLIGKSRAVLAPVKLKELFCQGCDWGFEGFWPVSTMKLSEHCCGGYQHGKITPNNASKSPDLGTTVLSDNTSAHLTCVIWNEFELGWKQDPLERSLLGASADMAVVGWLPAAARQIWEE